jgi:hypothetical protein
MLVAQPVLLVAQPVLLVAQLMLLVVYLNYSCYNLYMAIHIRVRAVLAEHATEITFTLQKPWCR